MVASTPKTLAEYLKNLNEKNAKLSDDKIKNDNNKKIASIELSANNIDKIKFGFNEIKSLPVTKNRGEEISKELTSIASNLASIQLLDEGVPPSHVEWTQQGEDGKSMKAEPLSLDPGGLKGSEPYELSALWKKVSVRNTSNSTTYIRGHLLNHHVHGPGSKGNLTPITGALNSQMEREVESTVKNKVLGENKVVSYHVNVEYGGHPNRINIPEEAQLATSLKFELHEMEPKSGEDPKQPSSWKKAKKIVVTPKMDHVLPRDLGIGERPTIDFGNGSPDDIVKKINEIDFNQGKGIGKEPTQQIINLIKSRGENERKFDLSEISDLPGIGSQRVAKLKEKFK